MKISFALQLNPPAGMAPGAQTLPLNLEALNVQQQLQPQVSSTRGLQFTDGKHFLSDGSLKGKEEFYQGS